MKWHGRSAIGEPQARLRVKVPSKPVIPRIICVLVLGYRNWSASGDKFTRGKKHGVVFKIGPKKFYPRCTAVSVTSIFIFVSVEGLPLRLVDLVFCEGETI